MLHINIEEKKYNKELILKDLNIQIEKSGIYGLIGKNGKGKTTLFKCALGLEKYKGKSIFKGENINLQNTAFCPAEPFIYDELTANEFYKFYSNLLEVSFSNQSDELFLLPKNKLLKNFSTGMKKKAYINAIFQKKFSLYFLDEPFNGLDIESNYLLMEDLKKKAKDSIIFISSHIIEVLYKNCSQIFLLENNKTTAYNPDEFYKIEHEFISPDH